MRALLLLGGLGTRLRPLTLERPKPLLPILNRPFLAYQIDLLKRFGVREVILALGHQSAHFRRKLGDGRAWGVRFIYSVEKEPLGTGGAMRLARPHLTERCFVFNGDIFSDFDLDAMRAHHKKTRAEATLALVEVPDPSAYGLVETRADGSVVRFLEKPAGPVFPSRTINAGCYLLEPGVFDAIPAGRAVSVEREVFPGLLAGGRRVAGWVHRGYWSDIGTLSSYVATHRYLLSVRRVGGAARRRDWMWADRGAVISSRVESRGTVLVGAGARVAPGVRFDGHVTIGANARVGAGARLSDCVLLEGARVGARSVVERSIVGAGAALAPDGRVAPGADSPDEPGLFGFS
ncbi:MAG: NDP-sugar synthase [Elusimicrobia bacterium]|nr:NDP-sugar synthase [Elusimicrobiota bacterium]MBK7545017.1 NDP-sugar synthase [Elusimicrobiota bacterium]MBK7574537.1 NDP-sugar synthase [Elusimicrobiota bacterium]MBK7688098.1 NDP-sugar synthase [Elusimicrobiota bacterium]MBK8126683.1 NDP-sugar synthase [Elusimicrobiota bacterium]